MSKEKISFGYSVGIILSTGIFFSLMIVSNFQKNLEISESITLSSKIRQIQIPSIQVKALIESVGLTSSGNVDVPVGPDNTGWFIKSVLPGEVGISVIDGHSGWKNNIPAVFDNLDKLKIGDKISIVDYAGGKVTFVVREFKTYKGDAIVPEVFKSDDGKSHLNLITCEKIVNKNTNEIGRLVVFADKLE